MPDLGAVERQLFVVCMLALTHFADEDETFEVQNEVVQLPELAVDGGHVTLPSVGSSEISAALPKTAVRES
jgi:hypothetical protein